MQSESSFSSSKVLAGEDTAPCLEERLVMERVIGTQSSFIGLGRFLMEANVGFMFS